MLFLQSFLQVMSSKSLIIPVWSSLTFCQSIYVFLKLWCPKLDSLLAFCCFGYRTVGKENQHETRSGFVIPSIIPELDGTAAGV